MSLFAKIFAIVVLTLFWGGFFIMTRYSLKLKAGESEAPDREPDAPGNPLDGEKTK